MNWSASYHRNKIDIGHKGYFKGNYKLITDPACEICSYPLDSEGSCVRTDTHSKYVVKTYTIGLYHDTSSYHATSQSDFLSKHIYNAKLYVHQAEPLGLAIAELIKNRDKDLQKSDILAPVPQHPDEIHHDRDTQEPFNQATEIAKAINSEIKIPIREDALNKTRTQSMQGTVAQRRAAVIGLYKSDPNVVRGKKILLIDDVSTAGCTEAACAEAMMKNGALEIRSYVCGINLLE